MAPPRSKAVPRQPAPAGAARPHLDALTGIRFFAALHVVLYHMHCTAWQGLPVWLERLRNHGDAAVALFYVLSGFILTYTHIGATQRVEQPRRFWIARFARIWPLYAIALAACIAFRLYDGGTLRGNLASMLASMSMLQAWTPDLMFGFNTPGWSLSVEAFFYLVFPLLVLPIARLQRVRSLVVVIVGLWLAGLAMTALYLHNALDPRLEHFDFWLGVVKYNPVARLPEFAIGIAIGRIHALRPEWATPRAADGLAGLALAVSLGVVAFIPDVPRVVLHDTLLAPAFALLILALARGGALSRLFGTRWLVHLGNASFALYILQEPVMDAYFTWQHEPFNREHSFGTVAGYVAVLVLVSLAAYRWLEMPLQALIRRRLNALLATGSRATARWPSPLHAGMAAALVAVVALAIHRAPEHVTYRKSRIGLALRALGDVRDVAYDVAFHDSRHLEATLEAMPGLRIHPFDSERGQTPEWPVVVSGKGWHGSGARRLAGEPSGDHAVWLMPGFVTQLPLQPR